MPWWRTAPSPRQHAADARAHPAVITDRASLDARNYFLDTAADEAKQLAAQDGAPPNADLIVHTTLEPKLQEGGAAGGHRASSANPARRPAPAKPRW